MSSAYPIPAPRFLVIAPTTQEAHGAADGVGIPRTERVVAQVHNMASFRRAIDFIASDNGRRPCTISEVVLVNLLHGEAREALDYATAMWGPPSGLSVCVTRLSFAPGPPAKSLVVSSPDVGTTTPYIRLELPETAPGLSPVAAGRYASSVPPAPAPAELSTPELSTEGSGARKVHLRVSENNDVVLSVVTAAGVQVVDLGAADAEALRGVLNLAHAQKRI